MSLVALHEFTSLLFSSLLIFRNEEAKENFGLLTLIASRRDVGLTELLVGLTVVAPLYILLKTSIIIAVRWVCGVFFFCFDLEVEDVLESDEEEANDDKDDEEEFVNSIPLLFRLLKLKLSSLLLLLIKLIIGEF